MVMVLPQYNRVDCIYNRELNRVWGRGGARRAFLQIRHQHRDQEIMFQTSEQGGLVTDILPGSWVGVAGARPGTRGEREEFSTAMRRQAARSHENIEEIIAYL